MPRSMTILTHKATTVLIALLLAVLGSAVWVGSAYADPEVCVDADSSDFGAVNCPAGLTTVGVDAFTTIGAAITAVDPNGTIYINPDTYNENELVVTKRITIQGDISTIPAVGATGPNVPVVDGSGAQAVIFDLQAGSDGTTIRGLTLQNVARTGSPGFPSRAGTAIYADVAVDNITVSYNNLIDLGSAGVLGFITTNTLDNWTVNSNIINITDANSGAGAVEFTNAQAAIVISNIITGSFNGIVIASQNEALTSGEISNNNISGTFNAGIVLSEITGDDISNINVTTNTIDIANTDFTFLAQNTENVTFRNNSITADTVDRVIDLTAAVTPDVLSNTIEATDIRLGARISGTTDVNFSYNVITVTNPPNLLGFIEARDLSSLATFDSNQVTLAGASAGVYDILQVFDTNSAQVVVSNNTFDAGASLAGDGAGVGVLDLEGVVDGTTSVTLTNNTITNFGDGVFVGAVIDNANTVSLQRLYMISNTLSNNTNRGLSLENTGPPNQTEFIAYNNTFDANATGIRFRGAGAFDATLSGDPTRANIFTGNTNNVEVDAGDPPALTPDILAYWNDWGLTPFEAIEGSITHQPDDNTLTLVRYFTLTITATPQINIADGVSVISATATVTGAVNVSPGSVISFSTNNSDFNLSDISATTVDNSGAVTITVTSNTPGTGEIEALINGITATVTITFTPSDLQVDKLDVPTANAGDLITYTIAYSDASSSTGVVITETVPANTGFVDNGITTWTDVGGGVYTTSVAPTASTRFISFTVQVTNPVAAGVTVITNNVSIGDDLGRRIDDVVTTTIVAAPDLQISKQVDLLTAVPNDTLVYTLTYTNTGSRDATGVVITETVPADTNFVGPSSWNLVGGGVYTFAVPGTLVADGTGNTITFSVAITDAPNIMGTAITNTATIADDGASGADENPADNTSNEVTTNLDLNVVLAIAKDDGGLSPGPGEVLTYTVTITNNGTGTANNVVVTETVPTNTDFADGTPTWVDAGGGLYTYAAGNIGPGADTTLTFTVRITDSGANYVPAGFEEATNTVLVADDTGITATTSITTPIDAAPDFGVQKTVSLTEAVAGQTLVYSIFVTNAVTATQAATIIITETVPANTTFNAALSDPNWTLVNTNVYTIVSMGSFLPGNTDSTSFAVDIDITTPAATVISNTASVIDINGEDLNPADNVSNVVTTTVLAGPALDITKTGPAAALAGDILTYTIVYSNVGSVDAANVVLTETVPANTVAFGALPGWSLASAGVYTAAIGNLVAPTGGTITFTVQINDPLVGVDTLTNTVVIGADNTPVTNTATFTTAIVDAATEVGIVKAFTPTNASPGQVLYFTLAYSNSGTADATGVVLSDTVPANTTFNFALSPGWTQVGATDVYTFDVGTLAIGASDVTTFAVTVDGAIAASTITNTAEITAANDTLTANNSSTVVVPVSFGALALTKDDGGVTVQPGDTITYTLTITNTGAASIADVVISETVPANTAFDSTSSDAGWVAVGGGVYTFSIASLTVGTPQDILFAVTVTDTLTSTTTITNTALAGAPNIAEVSATDTTGVVIPGSGVLALAKDDGGVTVQPGDTITYTLSVTNTGVVTLSDVVITETVPADTAFDSTASDAGWVAVGGGVYTFSIASLTVGTPQAVLFAVTVTDTLTSTTTITNTALAGAPGIVEVSATDTTGVVIPGSGVLALAKDDGGVTVQPGDTITYTLTITNTGAATLSDVVITETVPADTAFDSTSSDAGWVAVGGGVYTFSIASLTVGTPQDILFAVTVTDTLTNPTTITNTALAGAPGIVEISIIDTTPITVVSGLIEVYLPEILRNDQESTGDLIVTNIQVVNDMIEVTIRNDGPLPVTNSFWVDLYFNPNPVPTAVNQIWSDGRSEYGLVWGVTDSLAAGQEITLVRDGTYYSTEFSRFPGALTPGQQVDVYVQVDSFNQDTTFGAVLEPHEEANNPYNNISNATITLPDFEIPAFDGPPSLPGGSPTDLPTRPAVP